MALVLTAAKVDVANFERFGFAGVVELCAIGADASFRGSGALIDGLKFDMPTVVGCEIPLKLACDGDGGSGGGHASDRLN